MVHYRKTLPSPGSLVYPLRWVRVGRFPETYFFGEDCLSGEVALHLGASF